MSWKIEWPKQDDLFSWGRNRLTLQTGVQIHVHDYPGSTPKMTFYPINSTGRETESCYLMVPLANLDDLIGQLQAIKAHLPAPKA